MFLFLVLNGLIHRHPKALSPADSDLCRKENDCPYNQLISNLSRIGRKDLTVLL